MGKQREALMKRVAYDLGLKYFQEDNFSSLPLLQGFWLFRRGRRQRIQHILHYKDALLDTDIRIFDYRYVRGSGKSRRTYNQTVFFVQSKNLGLPEFLMRPERFFHRIGDYLGLQSDIDFEEFPDFSKNYFLTGDDEDYIRASMNEDVLHFFSINQNWSLEGVNYYMIFYKKNRLIHSKDIKQFFGMGLKLIEMLEAKPLK